MAEQAAAKWQSVDGLAALAVHPAGAGYPGSSRGRARTRLLTIVRPLPPREADAVLPDELLCACSYLAPHPLHWLHRAG